MQFFGIKNGKFIRHCGADCHIWNGHKKTLIRKELLMKLYRSTYRRKNIVGSTKYC